MTEGRPHRMVAPSPGRAAGRASAARAGLLASGSSERPRLPVRAGGQWASAAAVPGDSGRVPRRNLTAFPILPGRTAGAPGPCVSTVRNLRREGPRVKARTCCRQTCVEWSGAPHARSTVRRTATHWGVRRSAGPQRRASGFQGHVATCPDSPRWPCGALRRPGWSSASCWAAGRRASRPPVRGRSPGLLRSSCPWRSRL